MPTATANAGGNIPMDWEDGRCILTLEKVKDKNPDGSDIMANLSTGPDPRWRWVFDCVNQQTGEHFHDEKEFEWKYETNTSRKFGKGGPRTAQARLYAEALMGREIEPGESIDLEDLEGFSMSAMMTANEKGYIDIISVKPYTKKKGAAAAKPVAVTASANDDDEGEND